MDRGAGVANFCFGLLVGITLLLVLGKLLSSQEELDLAEYRAVRDFARESFVREVSNDELVTSALQGMLRGLDDYSRFYDNEQSQTLQRETHGRFKGIGAIFRQPVGAGRVLYPLPRSPAAQAGLQVGDQFLTVAGTPMTDLSEEEFRALLSAPPGGRLEARVRGLDDEERELRITPASVIDPTVRHARLLDPQRGIGYLAITSFTSETPAEFDRAFDFLRQRGAEGLVIDLRGNLGGVLESAIAVAQRFISEGVLVSTEGRGEPILYHARKDAAWYEGTPLVVLVNGESASASEVLAGALQDHRAGVLVGAPTYGKGMVQTIRRFDRWGTRAKVTSSYYYSPTGRNFERSADPNRDYGILPDVLVELTRTERRALTTFLRSYGPGPESVPALEAWEQAENVELVDELPTDPQLVAGLALFAGERPGPAPLEAE
jgi:carboxyl-terminal processing protease